MLQKSISACAYVIVTWTKRCPLKVKLISTIKKVCHLFDFHRLVYVFVDYKTIYDIDLVVLIPIKALSPIHINCTYECTMDVLRCVYTLLKGMSKDYDQIVLFIRYFMYEVLLEYNYLYVASYSWRYN